MTSATERRGGTRALIDKMLSERQQMLVLYEKVAGVAPYDEGRPDPEALQDFSQTLVDYTASGHFGLYSRIADGSERRQRVVELAEQTYARIAETTETVLAFNDAYERAAGAFTGELARLLARLAEDLAERIELEDRLIASMLE